MLPEVRKGTWFGMGTVGGFVRRGAVSVVPRFLVPLFLLAFAAAPLRGQPPSAIAVDRRGLVFYVDVGSGVWSVDLQGRMWRARGPRSRYMAVAGGREFPKRSLPPDIRRGVNVVVSDPTLIFSDDFPVAVGHDGALYYPGTGFDGGTLVLRLAPSGESAVRAVLPGAADGGPGMSTARARRIEGLAAGPDGSLYCTDTGAVMRISRDGTVSVVACGAAVTSCLETSDADGERPDPGLSGLAVGSDGTIYAAATACRAVLKITREGSVSVALQARDDWTPTGVALSGGDLYVLEYRNVEGGRGVGGVPRVRRISRDGALAVIASPEIRERQLRELSAALKCPEADYRDDIAWPDPCHGLPGWMFSGGLERD